MHLQYKNTKQNIQAVQKRARHVAPHLHNTLELVYVTEGTLELGVGQGALSSGNRRHGNYISEYYPPLSGIWRRCT